jgi:hypothetical protein
MGMWRRWAQGAQRRQRDLERCRASFAGLQTAACGQKRSRKAVVQQDQHTCRDGSLPLVAVTVTVTGSAGRCAL